MGTIQTSVTRTYCNHRTHTGLWTGLSVHLPMAVLQYTWTWICTSRAGTTLDVAQIGFRGTSLVTKLNQVNKTVFVFFPCSKLVFPRLDDCILYFHPVVASTSTLHSAYCTLFRTTRNKLQVITLYRVYMLFIFCEAPLLKPRF